MPEEVPVSIVSDRDTRCLCNKVVHLVKVSWYTHCDEEATGIVKRYEKCLSQVLPRDVNFRGRKFLRRGEFVILEPQLKV